MGGWRADGFARSQEKWRTRSFRRTADGSCIGANWLLAPRFFSPSLEVIGFGKSEARSATTWSPQTRTLSPSPKDPAQAKEAMIFFYRTSVRRSFPPSDSRAAVAFLPSHPLDAGCARCKT